MRVAELYQSVQGEGLLTGTPSVFVRTSGCNLRCRWCDTPHASWTPEGEDLSVDEICAAVARLDCAHVVLTGGEPMLFAELVPLTERLRAAGHHLTIETAGTLWLELDCDLMSISPKLAGSAPAAAEHPRWHARHERTRHAPEVIRRLTKRYPYQLKFVVADPADAAEVLAYLEQHPELDRGRVLLMPEGTTAPRLAEVATWLELYCQRTGLSFCPRRHIEWFGHRRGT